MIETIKLGTYEGHVVSEPQGDSVVDTEQKLEWRSDKETLNETVEGVMAKLLELKNNPYGIPLQRTFAETETPAIMDTTLVDILEVRIDDLTQEVVASLRVKPQQTPVGDDEVAEEIVDTSVEDTFPASDPPALKSTK